MDNRKARFDFTGRCWHCQGKAVTGEMSPYLCSDCGATWVDIKHLRAAAINGGLHKPASHNAVNHRVIIGVGSRIKNRGKLNHG